MSLSVSPKVLTEYFTKRMLSQWLCHQQKRRLELCSEKRIFSMKDGAVLINAGRGNALDSDALAEALMCGKLGAGAAPLTSRIPEPLPKGASALEM